MYEWKASLYVATVPRYAYLMAELATMATRKPRVGGPQITLQLTFNAIPAMEALEVWLDCLLSTEVEV